MLNRCRSELEDGGNIAEVGEDAVERWELEGRESIRDLVARYNANGDSGRFDQVMDLFAPDAVMQLGEGPILTGLEAIRTIFTGAAERVDGFGEHPKYVRHMTSTLQIDLIDRSSATSWCYYAVLTHIGLEQWGRYLDRYRTVDGAWRFADRRVTIDGRADNALFGSP